MKGFLRQSEVCARLGICDQTWMNWRKAGAVQPPAPLPGVNKWPVEYIESLAQGEARPQGRRYFGAHRAVAVK